MLRQWGVPAHARCGFATYLEENKALYEACDGLGVPAVLHYFDYIPMAVAKRGMATTSLIKKEISQLMVS